MQMLIKYSQHKMANLISQNCSSQTQLALFQAEYFIKSKL